VPTPGVWSLGFHPSGHYLYAALRDSNNTVPFHISQADGSISAVNGGVGADHQPVSVTLTPDGDWAYIAYQNIGGPGTIGLYAVDTQTGALVPPASPFLDGIEPLDQRIDVTGGFLYTANSGTDTISVFALQSADGFLQPLTPAPTGLVPCALALLQHWQ
jgi:DNA-binding beta-propeller fold protein YncE